MNDILNEDLSEQHVDETIIMGMPQSEGVLSISNNSNLHSKKSNSLFSSDGISSRNKVLDAASTLLAVLLNLEPTRPPKNIADLYVHLNEELQGFQEIIKRNGVNSQDASSALYLLCSAIDEIVLNTPWGHSSNWSQRTLLTAVCKDNNGGEKCFLLLEKLMRSPAGHIDLLELFYVILSLGFKGKYYDDRSSLNKIIDNLFEIIRQYRGEPERDLSSFWKGERTDDKPLNEFIPIWLVIVSLFSVLMVFYIGFRFWLNAVLDPTFQNLINLTDLGPIKRQDQVEIVMTEDKVTEFTLEDINFKTGKADLPDKAKGILKEIVNVIDKKFQPDVTVIGHTDSVGKAQANKSLSKRRAESVRQELIRLGIIADDIKAYGMGAEQPIASNLTREGRKKNRRVEIIVTEK